MSICEMCSSNANSRLVMEFVHTVNGEQEVAREIVPCCSTCLTSLRVNRDSLGSWLSSLSYGSSI